LTARETVLPTVTALEATRATVRMTAIKLTAGSQPGTSFAPLRWNLNAPMRGGPACSDPRGDLVTDIEDRLIELYVQQDEAGRTEDRDQARGLQVEIDKAAAQREEIRRRP
jgi:hypothetical protein